MTSTFRLYAISSCHSAHSRLRASMEATKVSTIDPMHMQACRPGVCETTRELLLGLRSPDDRRVGVEYVLQCIECIVIELAGVHCDCPVVLCRGPRLECGKVPE